jgi:hypothetical protein
MTAPDASVQAAAPAAARSTRRTRAELRALLIDAGTAILLEEGLGTGAEHLTFKRVFERVAATSGVRVTNASVIGRVWQNQAEFQSAVLASVAADEVAMRAIEVADVTRQVAAAGDLSSPDGRRRAVQELARLTAETNLELIGDSATWAAVVGVWALSSATPRDGAGDEIHAALERSYAAVAEHNLAFARGLQAAFGLRLRPGLELEHFTSSISALIKGCALRDRAQPQSLHGIVRPTGPGGADQEWTILGIGMEALFERFFELDPDWRPPA